MLKDNDVSAKQRPITFRRVYSAALSVVRLLLLIGISYIILYPLFVKFSVVFMSKEDIYDVTVKWLPRHLTIDNIITVGKLLDYIPSVLKTAGICITLSVLQVASCTLAGYGFARFNFKGKGIIFALVILTLVIPPQTYIITLYTQFQHFDLLGILRLVTGGRSVNLLDISNGSLTLILLSASGMGIRNGLYIYMLRQVFKGVPKELDEAARVDGAGIWTVFGKIMIPNVKASITVVFLLSFVWQWNDTFYTSLFSPNLKLLSEQLEGFIFTITSYLGGWQTMSDIYTSVLMNTCSLFVIFPLLVLFVICQRAFVDSVDRSGIVG